MVQTKPDLMTIYIDIYQFKHQNHTLHHLSEKNILNKTKHKLLHFIASGNGLLYLPLRIQLTGKK